MAPLPFSDPGARIAFDVVLGVWFLAELVVRLRSHLNRRGARMDRGSLLVVVALMAVGLGGAFPLAEHVHQTAIGDGRWPLFVAGLVVRIRLEERARLAGLGEPYRHFAAARPHLFPGLW